MGNTSKRNNYIKFFIGLILFGGNGVVSNHIAMTSYQIVFFKTLIGSIFLLLTFLVTGNKFTFFKHWKDFGFVAISGLSMGVCWLFLFEAYVRIGVGLSSLLYYCGPIIVMALSPVLFKERLRPSIIFGFAVVLAGVVLVNGNVFMEGGSMFGLFCGAMTGVMYVTLVISNKFVKEMAGIENSLWTLIFSFVAVTVYTVVTGGCSLVIPSGSIVPTLVLGIVNTGLGCYCYFSSIGKLPVQTVAVCGYLEPLSAVILSILFIGEVMTGLQGIGVVCIIGGAVYCELSKSGNLKLLHKNRRSYN